MPVKRLAACTYLSSTVSQYIQAVSLIVRHFSTFFAHFGLPWVRPWDYLGKCHMDRKRIQCLSNPSNPYYNYNTRSNLQHARLHVPIYLEPFLRYSELLVENCDIFTPTSV